MDVDRGIRVAVDTGNVTLGSSKTIQALKLGKGKLVIIAENCPQEVTEDVMQYSKLSEIPVYTFQGSSVDLGSVVWETIHCSRHDGNRSWRFHHTGNSGVRL